MRVESVMLRATVADFHQGPKEPMPQVAFAGRSNVGKSSLLNALFGTKLAAVSKHPGKTRTINYYLVNGRYFFVDLPGYGFARTSLAERQQWGKRISAYLCEEQRLRLVVGLIDPRIPTSPLDADLVTFVREAGKPLLVVLTKADKLAPGPLAEATRRVQRDLGLETVPVAVSAVTGSGCRAVWHAILSTLDSSNVLQQGA